ncbi:hypothetical protein EDD17DRAFT_1503696 [Pisolithus thermaeus]|nr:hypothetical protein EDD17DRAFT_1503696 [Pisolithus thermaeus]
MDWGLLQGFSPPYATMGGPSQPAGFDEDEWEDIDYIPLHLHPLVGSKYLTVINVTGVHFMLSQPCQCMNAESYHKQLLCAKLYPSTFDKPSMVFTFLVLDDFLRDNVECRMSGMNYYSKLCQVTSTWQWHLLKLLKWSGYQGNSKHSTKGDLALWCVACPQPGINLSPQDNLDDWRYTRTVVMDGNFKAEHMSATPHITEKSTCNNHKAISQASASHRKLNSTGVGATTCVQHGCFYPHSVVDFQKGKRYMKNLWRQVDNSTFLEIAPSLRIVVGIGMWHVHGHKKECYARYSPLFIRGSGWVDGEIIKTLWSTLNIVSASTHGMTSLHRQELLDFQMNDSNFMEMIQMISSLSWKLKENWWRQGEAALKDHIHDPSVMDIFEIQLMKAPTVHGVELHLLQTSTASGMHHGATSWLTCGLVIEEAEVTLAISQKAIGPNPSDLKQLVITCHADRVAAEWKSFIVDGRIYLQMDTILDDRKNLAEMELELQIAQANDALHAYILHWLTKQLYSGELTTMIALGAKPKLLAQYQELQKSHLTTNTAAFTQGAYDHQASQLPWFWSIDIPRDTSSKSWLTEFSTIHLQKFTESTGSVLKQEKIIGQRRNLC